MLEEFERLCNVKWIDSYLFMDLWQDGENSEKYFISRDLNFEKTFYACNDADAKKIFKNYINNV